MSGGMSVGDGINYLGAGIAWFGGALALAAFFLGAAQCGVADKTSSARRYEACMRATSSIAECGKP